MITFLKHIEIILYVADQEKSSLFYTQLLQSKATLQVPGMTEFTLNAHCKLGLMPNNGIAKILSDAMPHPETGIGIPRCELYLQVDNIQSAYENAISAGAQLISPMLERNWGDTVCYFADADGHVIAFAQRT